MNSNSKFSKPNKNSRIQRIIDELAQGPKAVDQFSVGVSGVYLRSILSAMVELGMLFEHSTWPRTYSLKSSTPDEFLPTVDTGEVKTTFDAMMTADIELLNRERITQHLVWAIRQSDPEELLMLKQFMGYVNAKIQELLDNLEPVSIKDIKVRK